MVRSEKLGTLWIEPLKNSSRGTNDHHHIVYTKKKSSASNNHSCGTKGWCRTFFKHDDPKVVIILFFRPKSHIQKARFCEAARETQRQPPFAVCGGFVRPTQGRQVGGCDLGGRRLRLFGKQGAARWGAGGRRPQHDGLPRQGERHRPRNVSPHHYEHGL